MEKFNDKGKLIEHLIYGRGQKLYEANLQVALYTKSLLPLPSVLRQTSEDDQTNSNTQEKSRYVLLLLWEKCYSRVVDKSDKLNKI